MLLGSAALASLVLAHVATDGDAWIPWGMGYIRPQGRVLEYPSFAFPVLGAGVVALAVGARRALARPLAWVAGGTVGAILVYAFLHPRAPGPGPFVAGVPLVAALVLAGAAFADADPPS